MCDSYGTPPDPILCMKGITIFALSVIYLQFLAVPSSGHSLCDFPASISYSLCIISMITAFLSFFVTPALSTNDLFLACFLFFEHFPRTSTLIAFRMSEIHVESMSLLTKFLNFPPVNPL